MGRARSVALRDRRLPTEGRVVASIRKHHGKWQVRYRAAGTMHCRSFSAKRDADRFKVQVESSLQRGEWSDPKFGQVTTVSELCDLWWKDFAPQCRPATQQAYESAIETHIKPKLGKIPLTAVKPPMVRAWVGELRSAGVGVHSLRRAFQLLNRM